MKKINFYFRIWFLSFINLLFAFGCSSSDYDFSEGKAKGFIFNYRGDDFRLECVSYEDKDGYNILSRREPGIIYLLGIDKDQDGELDDLIAGRISFDQANEIYHAGIAYGRRIGLVKPKFLEREYIASDKINEYVIQTYILALGQTYNKFLIKPKVPFQKTFIIVDLEANGTLDRIEKGIGNVADFQESYNEILSKGMEEGRIAEVDGNYKVIY